jgi:hypothetical protein
VRLAQRQSSYTSRGTSGTMVEMGLGCEGRWQIGDLLAVGPIASCSTCDFCLNGSTSCARMTVRSGGCGPTGVGLRTTAALVWHRDPVAVTELVTCVLERVSEQTDYTLNRLDMVPLWQSSGYARLHVRPGPDQRCQADCSCAVQAARTR